MSVTVALIGNPNTGKSSLFNLLTGSRQHVGNWPGKTVTQRTGRYRSGTAEYEVVDLPGTYSLHANSPEEEVARDFIAANAPDVVVIVVDAANLERNLYLTLQVLETGIAAVVALNMMDVAARRGDEIDTGALEEALGVPVVPVVARRGGTLEHLRAAIAGAACREAMA